MTAMKSRKIQPSFSLIWGILLFWSMASYAQQHKTYVIVHGAWGGSWSFKQVASLLAKQGHTVYRPSLTGMGERVHLSSPDINLNTHTLDVINTVLFEDLHDIVLVGHSYGGMVITGVADSIPERISQLIYLDAFVPNDGESVMTARKESEIQPQYQTNSDFVIPFWVSPTAPLPHDVPQPLKTFTTAVKRKNTLAMTLPTAYVLTVDSATAPQKDSFYFFAERAKARGWKIYNMEADHNPQQSQPSELVELLNTL
jgi:pimeloyl-ACP methyl ester carboxylesterase